MKLNKKNIITSLVILVSLYTFIYAQVSFSPINPPAKTNNLKNKTDTIIENEILTDSISDDSIGVNDVIEEVLDTTLIPDSATNANVYNSTNDDETGDDESNVKEDTEDIPPASYSSFKFSVPVTNHPLTKNLSLPVYPTEGLENRHIALWQSHGMYYNQSKESWTWQRPNIWTTREDLYTQSYIVPFLIPMLENAGANILIPRERDTQNIEIIVDNDKSSEGSEFITKNNLYNWQIGIGTGFGNFQSVYKDNENPFTLGTYYQANTTREEKLASSATWLPYFPKKDFYALYVAYRSLPFSTDSALYTVYHAGDSTKFAVNQTMGGGTWIYLGTFLFDKGKNEGDKIVLSNLSNATNKVVTADAIKLGGGLGNISRKRADLVTKRVVRIPVKGRKRYITRYKYKKVHGKRKRVRVRVPVKRYKTKVYTSVKHFYDYSSSQEPRFMEGARYWLQWAGIPYAVYSHTNGQNDYSDDFQSRGFWVNYLSGGSSSNPGSDGLNIPLDMSMALHSDAGIKEDSIVGTLAIHTVRSNNGSSSYSNGISRWVGRDLAVNIQDQVVNDIQNIYNKNWPKRGLWNRSYSESRVPEVPTVLVELLSHQNFNDMRYGLDPRFQLNASRSIYKGILRFIAQQNDFKPIVEPLAVNNFSAEFEDSATVKLQWKPVEDPLEKSATPTGYIVYTRKDGDSFNNGEYVTETNFNKKIDKNSIYSFKVEAVNNGGRSFPSEILSVCKTDNDSTILIINAFNRVSAPYSFESADEEGFNFNWDAGVPYIKDFKTTGIQTEFRKNLKFAGNENPGTGKSETNLQGEVIAGNTFDYPYIHGQSIKNAGYSFVSCSEKAIENGEVKMSKYQGVDLILGKQRQWTNLKLNSNEKVFKTFTPKLRKALINYADSDGNIFISGQNVVSDLSLTKQTTPEEYGFLVNFLKAKWIGYKINGLSKIGIAKNKTFNNQVLEYYTEPNSTSYFVEAPDILVPTDKKAIAIGGYDGTKYSAGVLYNGSYNICTFGFPFETIKSEKERDIFMKSVLKFLFQPEKEKKKVKKLQTNAIKNVKQ